MLRWSSVGFHGLTAALAAVAVLPLIVSAWLQADHRIRQYCSIALTALLAAVVIVSLPVVLSLLSARAPLESGFSLAKSSINSFEGGQSGPARVLIGRAAGDLGRANRSLSAWWNVGGYLVPVLAQQERALASGTSAGARLTRVASGEAGALDLSNLRFKGGRLDVGALESLRTPTVLVDQAVISAQEKLTGASSAWLLQPIRSRLHKFDNDMTRFRSDADLAVLAAKDGPSLLGVGGARHYFVAFMTPAETRGLGGFLGAYGILTVDDGAMKLTQSGRPIQLTANPSPSWHLSGPSSYLARYGAFNPQDNFEDLSYAPDLPTVGEVISQLYPQVGGSPIDGVLVLDPDGLGALLKLTGPVSVPGLGQLDSENAGQVLLRQQYLDQAYSNDQRHDYLQAALAAGFHELTSSSLPSPRTISSALGDAVRQGRLLFWTNHRSDQAFLSRLALEGAFPSRDGGDLLAVTDANAANNKIDAYLDQRVSDQVTYGPANGGVDATVTIDMHNAATAGLPQYVVGSYAGSNLPVGTSRTWLTIYSPLNLLSVTVDGKAASFSRPTEEDGVYAYSGYVDVPASSTTEIVAKLNGRVSPGGYSMVTRLQPLANAQTFSVSVRAGGPSFPGGTWTADADQVQRHSWPLSSRR